MIARNPRNYSINPERNQEAAFTGTTGINTSRPPTFRECVYDATNFDVYSDGALTLRKPLILLSRNEFLTENVKLIRHVFDKETKLILGSSNQLALIKNNEYIPIVFKYLDIDNREHIFNFTDIVEFNDFDFSHCNILNTANTTLITGVKIFLSKWNLLDSSVSENQYGYRYLKLQKVNNEWILEIVTSDVNLINSSDTIPFNPDTTLDYPIAIRDNYYAPIVSVEAVLAYAKSITYKESVEVFEKTDSVVSETTTATIHKYEEE